MRSIVHQKSSESTDRRSLNLTARLLFRYLVIAGDCRQLPPLVASPAGLETKPGARQAYGLGRPLLARLMAMGYSSHLLRFQYRQRLPSDPIKSKLLPLQAGLFE